MSIHGYVCDCCSAPSCPTDYLDFQNRFAQRIKCGHEGFVPVGSVVKMYLVESKYNNDASGGTGDLDNWTETCAPIDDPTDPNPIPACSCTRVAGPNGAGVDCGSPIPDTTTDTHTGSHNGSGDVCSSIDLSDEDTTADLTGRAESSLAAQDWEDGSVNPERNLEVDERTLGLFEMQVRAHHTPTGSCYLRVWSRSVFTPSDGGSPVDSGWVDFYTWNGTGDPCFGVATNGNDRAIIGDWNDFPPPDDPGTTVVTFYATCNPGVTAPPA